MKKVVIFRGTRTPTQSGSFKSKFWCLKFDKLVDYEEDTMTGWKGNAVRNTNKLIFFRKRDFYAENKNYSYRILSYGNKKIRIKSYGIILNIIETKVRLINYFSYSTS